jgi:hypothetical protein
MNARRIERIYSKTITKGNDNPMIQYVTGTTLKRMAAIAGRQINQTTEGHVIAPDEVYAISKHGIFLID